MKKNQMTNVLSFLLILVGLILWFSVNPLEAGNTFTTELSYLEAAFGFKLPLMGEIAKFSFLNLLPVILLAISLLIILVKFLNPKAISNKMAAGVVLIFTLASGIMLFFIKNFMVPAATLINFDGYNLSVLGYITPIVILLASLVQLISFPKK